MKQKFVSYERKIPNLNYNGKHYEIEKATSEDPQNKVDDVNVRNSSDNINLSLNHQQILGTVTTSNNNLYTSFNN